MSAYQKNHLEGFESFLVVTGIAASLFTALLAGRLVWEETSLTLARGPQMIGFSLAHGAGAVLFLAPLLLVVWMLVALTAAGSFLWRKRMPTTWLWSTIAVSLILFGVLSTPPVFFQWALIGQFSRSPHAADLMASAAFEGDVRTVRGYLAHGVPLEAQSYDGATAAYMAAVGGSLPTLEMLSAKGANLSATNLYGDSPLQAAIERHNASVVAFLKAHGAALIVGTPEQRNAATETIVHRGIEEMDKNMPR